ncbi:MAG: hypothetical protein WHX53_06795, partial [Anaerolineae bacterium]
MTWVTRKVTAGGRVAVGAGTAVGAGDAVAVADGTGVALAIGEADAATVEVAVGAADGFAIGAAGVAGRTVMTRDASSALPAASAAMAVRVYGRPGVRPGKVAGAKAKT